MRKWECEKIADEKIDDVINIAFFTPIAKCLYNLQIFILYKVSGAWEYILIKQLGMNKGQVSRQILDASPTPGREYAECTMWTKIAAVKSIIVPNKTPNGDGDAAPWPATCDDIAAMPRCDHCLINGPSKGTGGYGTNPPVPYDFCIGNPISRLLTVGSTPV